jgi:hypothetical protein
LLLLLLGLRAEKIFYLPKGAIIRVEAVAIKEIEFALKIELNFAFTCHLSDSSLSFSFKILPMLLDLD